MGPVDQRRGNARFVFAHIQVSSQDCSRAQRLDEHTVGLEGREHLAIDQCRVGLPPDENVGLLGQTDSVG